jgi:exportin-2 (importin alpha re-exporter)
MDPVQAQLAGLFLSTLDMKNETRRAATNALMDGERSPGFTMSLLRLAGNDGFELKVRLLAATHFKNVVKRNWNEPEPAVIPAEDRKTIKDHLVGLMTSVPNLVQRQLSESLAIISRRDFPAEWPNLLPDLVSRLNTTDINVLVGVLETAASIFERFRNVPDNDDVRREIRYSLDSFGNPLTAIMGTLGKMLDDATARGEGKAALTPILVAIKLVVSIYHSLSWLELPDIFEDAMAQWMTAFRKFLTYSNPALEATADDTEEGPIEAMQASVLDVIALLADKYDEEFEAFFPTFAGDVWSLLSGASSARIMAESMDPLVIRAVKFLTASVSNAVHVSFFKSPGILPALIERVIVTNIRLRTSGEWCCFRPSVEMRTVAGCG